jgi:predicted small integral membrane protein
MKVLAWFGSLQMALTVLAAMTSLYMGLVTLGNISDFDTNRVFVEHVFAMDTTFSSPHTKWRAISDPRLITAAYYAIIFWEFLTTIVLTLAFLCWLRAIAIQRAVTVAIQLSTCGWIMQVILFGGGFITVGGEWFQMWQSSKWNGMQPALQNVVVASVGLILANLVRPESPNEIRRPGR